MTQVFERAKTFHALDRAATMTSNNGADIKFLITAKP
jgi:hypothetical protein